MRETSTLLTQTTDQTDYVLVEFMEVLEGIDENKATAKLNEISMIDNKGRRIYY